MSEWIIERIETQKPTNESIKELAVKLTDAEKEIGRLKEEKEKIQGEYNKVVTNQYHKDYQVENQKKIIENLKKAMERYETENRAFRELLKLWI
jgi:chromosome segregation ATPase